jgi:pimeloyl-ACP methyl ester carboxylesterase
MWRFFMNVIRNVEVAQMKVQTWQRSAQLVWLLTTVLVLGALVHVGAWPLALLLAVPLCLGHLFWLGLQFHLAAASARRRAAAGDESPPAPTRAAWLRAWWAEVWMCTRSYGWQQPWTAAAHQSLLPGEGAAADAASGRAILFVHGYLCSGGFWAPWLHRLRALRRPFACVSLQPALADIDSYAPQIEAEFRRLHAATGVAPLIVCHSMGGLVVRAWWRRRIQQGARAGRLAVPLDIVGLACPHSGTWVARLGMGEAATQMSEGSGWLAELVAFEAELAGQERPNWVCLYSDCDNMVYPPRNACLDGGREALLSGLAHMELAFDARVVDLVLWLLDENPGSATWGVTMPAGLDVALTRPVPL